MDAPTIRPRPSPEDAGAGPAVPRIVVGVDGSDGSRAALRYGLSAAARRGAVLDVVAAYPVGLPWRWDDAIDAPDVEAVRADLEARAHAFGAEVRDETPGVADVPVRVVTAPGHAAPVLLDAAASADLLVVGSAGRGVVRSAILGSVALHVATAARCPVVVVHQRASDVPVGAPVVAGVDDCPDSAAVVRAALDEAVRLRTDLELVAVFRPADGHWGGAEQSAPGESDGLRDRIRRRIDAELADVRSGRAAAPGERAPEVRIEVVEGSAREELAARSSSARLLVVGRRGHGAVRDLALGSVALHSVVHGRCPVMVVHPAAVPAGADSGALPAGVA